MNLKLIVSFLIIIIISIVFPGCSGKKQVRIFYAAAFVEPMELLKREFEKEHLDIEIIPEPSGSLNICRKVTELGQVPDAVLLADDRLFEEFFIPELASWYISLAKGRMVILLNEKSRYSSEISTDNWMEILFREDVRVGRVNHELGPVGYRTLMVLKLAGKKNGLNLLDPFIEKCGNENVRPDALDILPLLESGSIDYCFDYEHIALNHKIKYIFLGDDYDLSSSEKLEDYRKISITYQGKDGIRELKGEPVNFSYSVMKRSENKDEVIKFTEFMFSKKGREIIKKCRFPSGEPLEVFNSKKLPDYLIKTLKNMKWVPKNS